MARCKDKVLPLLAHPVVMGCCDAVLGQQVLASCLAHGVPCAITTNARTVEQRISQGFRFVTVGLDSGLPAGARSALQLGRQAAGQN